MGELLELLELTVASRVALKLPLNMNWTYQD